MFGLILPNPATNLTPYSKYAQVRSGKGRECYGRGAEKLGIEKSLVLSNMVKVPCMSWLPQKGSLPASTVKDKLLKGKPLPIRELPLLHFTCKT